MKLKAYAKINLTLDITGRREDGYHLLDSVMQSVSLCDTLDIERSDALSVDCSLPELSGENNIVYRAARLFFAECGLSGGARVFVEKNIPFPAGLGGGSADAAAVLCGLNRLYGAGLDAARLRGLGLRAGADVPFCITGGTARVTGIGECIESLPALQGAWFVLVVSGEKQSTAQMYARLDSRCDAPRRDTPQLVAALPDASAAAPHVGNAFAPVCGLSGADRLLDGTGAAAVSLSGSGPAVFGLYLSESTARQTAERLAARGVRAYYAEAVAQGVAFEETTAE